MFLVRGHAHLAGGRAPFPRRRATGGRNRARQEEGEERPAKAPRRAPRKKGATESRTNKKVEVIAMMKRAKGVTLAEIVEATGCRDESEPRHFVNG